jgi:flagellar basal-body rod protein FlgF
LQLLLDEEAIVDSGFYAACAGLRAQSEALEVAAHNLSNVNTAGFRGEQTMFQSLLAVSRPPANLLTLATNSYGVLEGTHLDLSQGNLTATGNPLDVGIEGAGFFVIQTARGLRYTRNGSFQISSVGELVTSTGDPVLGDNLRPIRVPAGAVAIAADGTVSVSGTVAGQIRLVDFRPGTNLTAEGGTLFSAPAGSEQAVAEPAMRQGSLESSNVEAVSSVVTLIGVERQAEMLSRALSLFDTEFNQIAASQLAKV